MQAENPGEDMIRRLQKLIQGPNPRTPTQSEPVDATAISVTLGERANVRSADDPLTILDVACGRGATPAMLNRKGYGSKISYHGIDRSEKAIDLLNAAAWRWTGLSKFKADIVEPKLFREFGKRFDIVLNVYTLHELRPLTVSSFVDDLLALAKPGGSVFILDMEVLPEGENEACGIPWTSAAVRRLVEAGGATVEFQETHQRSVPVLDVRFHIAPDRVFDVAAAKRVEEEWLADRLCEAVGAARTGLDHVRASASVDLRVAESLIESAIRSVYIRSHQVCEHGGSCGYRESAAVGKG